MTKAEGGTIYTKNPILLGYAELRYKTGTRLENLLYEKKVSNKGLGKYLWRWANDSEGRYNCLIEPSLGGLIKWETKKERMIRKGAAIQRSTRDWGRSEKYFAKARKYEDREDVYAKRRYPDHVTRIERHNEMMARLEAIKTRSDNDKNEGRREW